MIKIFNKLKSIKPTAFVKLYISSTTLICLSPYSTVSYVFDIIWWELVDFSSLFSVVFGYPLSSKLHHTECTTNKCTWNNRAMEISRRYKKLLIRSQSTTAIGSSSTLQPAFTSQYSYMSLTWNEVTYMQKKMISNDLSYVLGRK